MNRFDYKKVKEKYNDSLSQYDLEKVFNNPDHGTLNFKEIQEEFENFFDFIYNLEILDYKGNSYQQDTNQVDSVRNSLIAYFNQVQQFDIVQPNATSVRQDLINNIKNLISGNEGILDGILVKLQSKKFLRSSNAGEQIKKIQNVLSELENQKNELSNQVKEQSDILIKQKEEFSNKIKELESSGLATSKESQELAVGELDKFFTIQALEHKKKSDGNNENNKKNWFSRLTEGNGWLQERSLAVWILFGAIIMILILFSVSIGYFLSGKLSSENFEHIWGLRATLIIVTIFSVLYTNLYFATVQFSREKEMQFYNENKANIARTLKNYTRGLSETDRAVMFAKAAETLFNDVPRDNNRSSEKNNVSIPISMPLSK